MALIEMELNNVQAVLSNLNTRTELAGDVRVPAADINIECIVGNDMLAFFSPTLKADFFSTQSLDLIDGVGLKHPELKGPHGIEGDMFGAKATIDVGVTGPITLPECKITKFKFDPKEGGMIVLAFQIQCKPDAKQIGVLYEQQTQKITLTIEPTEQPKMADAK